MLCWIEVDLDAVADNVRALQSAAQPRAGVTAVVKAQAYGMGASAVANAARLALARDGYARRKPSAVECAAEPLRGSPQPSAEDGQGAAST